MHGGFYSDDWSLASVYRHHAGSGFWGAVTSYNGFLSSRPVLDVYLPLTYAVFGLNAAAQLAWAICLAVLVAICFFVLLRCVGVSLVAAATMSLLALLFPFADATKLWATASLNSFAVLLYLTGALLALRAFSSNGWRSVFLHGGSLVLYMLSVATYEITAGFIMISGLFYLTCARRPAYIRWAVDIGALAIVLKLTKSTTPKAVHGLGYEAHHARMIWSQSVALLKQSILPYGPSLVSRHFAIVLVSLLVLGAGVAFPRLRSWARLRRYPGPAVVIGAVVLVVAALYAFMPTRLPHGSAVGSHTSVRILLAILVALAVSAVLPADDDARVDVRRALILTVAGIGVVAAGFAALVPADDYYSPAGTGNENRINVAAALGFSIFIYAAPLLLGVLLFRSSRHRRLAASAAALFVSCVAGVSFISTLERHIALWDHAAAQERQILTLIDQTVPRDQRSSTIYVWGHRPEVADQVPVFDSTWDLINAVRLRWHNWTTSTFPILQTTGFRCGRSKLSPTNGLYDGGGAAATYSNAIFVDFMRRRAQTISTRNECIAAVARLSKPALGFVSIPSVVSERQRLEVSSRLVRGADPINAAPVTFTFGTGANAESCDAVTTSDGLASCFLSAPNTAGPKPLIATFRGTSTLRSTATRATVDVQ